MKTSIELGFRVFEPYKKRNFTILQKGTGELSEFSLRIEGINRVKE